MIKQSRTTSGETAPNSFFSETVEEKKNVAGETVPQFRVAGESRAKYSARQVKPLGKPSTSRRSSAEFGICQDYPRCRARRRFPHQSATRRPLHPHPLPRLESGKRRRIHPVPDCDSYLTRPQIIPEDSASPVLVADELSSSSRHTLREDR